MRPFFGAAQNCFVGNKPVIAPAAEILSLSMPPTSDVGLIRVRHSNGAPIQGRAPGLGPVENVFMAIIDVALGVNRFEMSRRYLLARSGLNRDRFYPVKGVLQHE